MEIIFTIIGICIVLLCVLHHKLYYHFAVVDEGKVYRSGQLSQIGFKLICKQYRIKTVVNLIEESQYRKQWFLKHKSFCNKSGINFVPIPLVIPSPPSQTPSSQIQQFIDICDNSVNYPILVHCKQGVLRTGVVVAIYQKHYHNLDNETIFKNMPRFGHDFQSPTYKTFCEFILNYKTDATATLRETQE